jgi:hypothetical protein
MESHGPGEWTGPAQDRESGRAGKGSASCIAVSAAASGGLYWELGREVRCYAGVKVGVDPLAFSPESSPNPPQHLGRCATQTVQLAVLFPGFAWTLVSLLEEESRVLWVRKFLFLFTPKWHAILAAPGFLSLMSISGFWKNSVLLLIVK